MDLPERGHRRPESNVPCEATLNQSACLKSHRRENDVDQHPDRSRPRPQQAAWILARPSDPERRTGGTVDCLWHRRLACDVTTPSDVRKGAPATAAITIPVHATQTTDVGADSNVRTQGRCPVLVPRPDTGRPT